MFNKVTFYCISVMNIQKVNIYLNIFYRKYIYNENKYVYLIVYPR